MRHDAFFGDGEHTFALTDDMITELERLTQVGIGALYRRVISLEFNLADLVEIIRLALIGGGANPETAMNLTDAYARNRPMDEILPLVLDILDARWNSPENKDAAE